MTNEEEYNAISPDDMPVIGSCILLHYYAAIEQRQKFVGYGRLDMLPQCDESIAKIGELLSKLGLWHETPAAVMTQIARRVA